MDELQEELTLITNAINAILITGQSFTINSGGASRSVNYADLNALYKRKKEIQNEINAISGATCSRAVPGW